MNRKDNTYCCVPQCKSRGNVSNISFHKFPSEKRISERRRKQVWIRTLRIGKEVSNRMVVCSKHFKRSDYILPDVPTKRPHLKRIAIPSLCLPQTVTEDIERVLEKEKSSKKVFHSVARKKIRKVKMDDALVTSTNSTFYEKEKLPAETSVKTFLKLGNNKKTNFLDEAVTPDEVEDGAENASFYRHCDSEDIFGQYIASEMRTLKDYPLLYLQTKQSILEALTSANFEFINSE